MPSMQDPRSSTSLAEMLERDVLPTLNLIVLLLPIVLLGVDFAAHWAIVVTLPDSTPNVAALDTPLVPQRVAMGDHDPTTTPSIATRSSDRPSHEVPTTSPSQFSDSLQGYGH